MWLLPVFFFSLKKLGFSLPLYVGFCITALLLFSLRWCSNADNRGLDLRSALILGTVQGLAVFPGVSRFALVYTVSRWLGCNARRSFVLTWMIFFPLMLAATSKGIYELARAHVLTQVLSGDVLLVMAAATAAGYVAFWCAARLAETNRLWWFGWYVGFVAVVSLL